MTRLTDQSGFDFGDVEACWRCDRATPATDVGLCEPCRDVLRNPATAVTPPAALAAVRMSRASTPGRW